MQFNHPLVLFKNGWLMEGRQLANFKIRYEGLTYDLCEFDLYDKALSHFRSRLHGGESVNTITFDLVKSHSWFVWKYEVFGGIGRVIFDEAGLKEWLSRYKTFDFSIFFPYAKVFDFRSVMECREIWDLLFRQIDTCFPNGNPGITVVIGHLFSAWQAIDSARLVRVPDSAPIEFKKVQLKYESKKTVRIKGQLMRQLEKYKLLPVRRSKRYLKRKNVEPFAL